MTTTGDAPAQRVLIRDDNGNTLAAFDADMWDPRTQYAAYPVVRIADSGDAIIVTLLLSDR